MIIYVPPVHNVKYDGVIVQEFHADKGQGIPRHSHAYSHLVMCQSGSLLIRKEGKEKTINKTSTPVNLIAGEWHELEALEDGTVFTNIFAEGKT